MKCSNCGNELSSNAMFCDNCGQKVELQSDEAQKCYCGNCGAEIEIGSEFCGNCGTPVGTSNSTDMNYIFCGNCGTKVSDNVQVCTNCGHKIQKYNNEQMSDHKNSLEKKKSTVIIVLLFIVTLILTALGMAVGYFFNNDNEDDDTIENSVTFVQKKSETEAPAVTDLLQPTVSPVSSPYVTASNDISQNTGDYLFNSDKEYISEAYLNTQSQKQVRLILNEMYARHGYIFTLDEYIQYFSAKAWYAPKYTSAEEAESYFNDIEKANKIVIVNYEISKNWR